MENYGNFFGQNLFVGAAGVLLMVGTFQSLDIKVNAMSLVLGFNSCCYHHTYFSLD